MVLIRCARPVKLAYVLALVVCLIIVFCLTTSSSPQYLPKNLYQKTLITASAAVARVSDIASKRAASAVNNNDANSVQSVSPYPKRVNMGECPPLYGKVNVVVIMVQRSYDTHYKVAQETLRCYLKSTNYSFVLIDLDSDERVNQACKHDQLFFKKHCAAATYLGDSDWTLVLDADTGVVNPNHCIEEWIDPRVDFIFYERFFNWEIASGNYIVKNTPFAKDFLMKWADWQYIQPNNWNGADNGVLQIHILQTVMPYAKQEIINCDKIWRESTGYDTYMAYVTCVKIYLGATRIWPGKLRILHRAHGWVRDGFMTADKFCDSDFMLHGWKLQSIGENGWNSPFTRLPNQSECGSGGYAGWYWRNESRDTTSNIRQSLANFEQSSGKSFPAVARIIPYLTKPDVAECYPGCDKPLDIDS